MYSYKLLHQYSVYVKKGKRLRVRVGKNGERGSRSDILPKLTSVKKMRVHGVTRVNYYRDHNIIIQCEIKSFQFQSVILIGLYFFLLAKY